MSDKCEVCDTELRPEMAFCPKCGTHRGDEPTSDPNTTQIGTVPPLVPGAGVPPTVSPPGPPPAAPAAPPSSTPPVAPPLVAPATAPPSAPPIVPDGSPSPDRSGGGIPAVVKVLVGAVVLVVIAAVAYALISGLSNDSGGASTPEEAVDNLANSVEAGDPVGVLENLEPSEVGPIAGVLDATEQRAQDLDLFASNGTMAGLELNVDDLEYKVDELEPDVAKVEITNGSLGVQLTQPDFGFMVAGQSDAIFDAGEKVDERVNLDAGYGEDSAGNTIDTFVIAVRRDGGWYVSPFYTLAELITEADDLQKPDFDASRTGVDGADSPEQAVQDFADGVADLDPEAAVAGLPPAEFGFAYDYLDAGIEEFGGDLEDIKADNDPQLEDLSLGDPEDLGNGKTKVPIESVSFSYDDDNGDPVDVTVEGQCVTVDDSDGKDETCLRDVLLENADDPAFADLLPDDQFVVVTKEDGRYYVSPVETVAAYAEFAVGNFDSRHLGALGVVKPKPLEVGQSVDATVASPYQPDVYTFDAPKSDAFIVSVTADKADLEGTVRPSASDSDSFSPQYFFAADGDDSTEIVTDPETGQYVVEINQDVIARSADESATVESTVAEDASGPGAPTPAPEIRGLDVGRLEYTIEVQPIDFSGTVDLDEEITGTIEKGEIVAYQYDAGGEIVELSADGPVDARLYDTTGFVVADSEGASTSTFEETHTLVIIGTDAGDYSVTLSAGTRELDFTPPSGLSDPGSIDPAAAPQQGAVVLGIPADYVLSGVEGDVTITVSSSDPSFVPNVELFDYDGFELDSAVPGTDGVATIDYLASAGDLWVISVTNLGPGDGLFTIDVSVT